MKLNPKDWSLWVPIMIYIYSLIGFFTASLPLETPGFGKGNPWVFQLWNFGCVLPWMSSCCQGDEFSFSENLSNWENWNIGILLCVILFQLTLSKQKNDPSETFVTSPYCSGLVIGMGPFPVFVSQKKKPEAFPPGLVSMMIPGSCNMVEIQTKNTHKQLEIVFC